MFNPFSGRLPGKKAVLSVLLVLVLSYSAFIVGNTMNQSHSEGGATYEPDIYWDKVSYGETDAVNAVASRAGAAAEAAADAAQAASASRSSSIFSLNSIFEDVSFVVRDSAADEAQEDMSAGRMVVYTAHVGLKVDDVDDSLDAIKLISDLHGGYISGVNTRDERGSVTIRVPQSRFHDAITDLEEIGEVTTRDLMGDDVTEEYVDLEAQLVSLRHQESRLFEIMEMGTTVDSVLRVERELERVRNRIESIEGRINFLDNRVDLSTITVNLREEIPEVEVIQAWFPSVDWRVPVVTGLSVLFTVAQGMITMMIILGPFIALGYVGVRLIRWYRSGKVIVPEDETALP